MTCSLALAGLLVSTCQRYGQRMVVRRVAGPALHQLHETVVERLLAAIAYRVHISGTSHSISGSHCHAVSHGRCKPARNSAEA